MAEKIHLEIVTPEQKVVSEDVQIVMAPGSMGEFGVLPGHTPFMTSLKVGAVRYDDEKGIERVVFVSGGFAEALPDKVTILADAAERRRDINIERAKAAKTRAEDRLAQQSDEVNYTRARASLMRAIMRIQLAESRSS